MKMIDMKGKTCGRLKVLEYDHTKSGKIYWKCQCECGKITIVNGRSLRSGEIQSCGCYRLECVHDTQFKDITGQIINGIKVLEFDHKDNTNQTYWKCVCPYCGKIFVNRSTAIRKGTVKSCGCYGTLANITHNMSRSRLYNIYRGMIKRCYISTTDSYSSYGGRGIYVCDEWLNNGLSKQEIYKLHNPGFTNFMNWALANGYDKNKTIDRRDVNGPYAPWNCRWATNKEQQRNLRSNCYINDGEETLIWADFCLKYNLEPNYVSNKIRKGWSLDAIVYAVKHPELKIHRPLQSQQHKYPGTGIYLDKDQFQVLIPKIPTQVKSIHKKMN